MHCNVCTKCTTIYKFIQNSDVLINLVAGNEVTLSVGIIAPIITVIGGLCVPIITVIVGCKCKLLNNQYTRHTHVCYVVYMQ